MVVKIEENQDRYESDNRSRKKRKGEPTTEGNPYKIVLVNWVKFKTGTWRGKKRYQGRE